MSDPAVRILHGDALTALRALGDDSVDAVVTDPPYGLAEHKPAALITALTAWATGDREHVPDGKGFMGRDWDAFVPPPAVWDECLRVLKPGGYLLAFAGSRTADLMGLSVRMAGFEIRDTIMWIYGSGFPKSLDVSKAIDKAAGAERKVIGVHHRHGGGSASSSSMAGDLGTASELPLTAPATEGAVRFQGWGTALKPAQEPIIVARKPLASTVAGNVLAHGTGALNIDGCRVGYRDEADRAQASVPQPTFGTKADGAGTYNYRAGEGRNGQRFEPGSGRWPSNVVLTHHPDCADPGPCTDGCPVAELDQQSGTLKSGSRQAGEHELMGYMGSDVVPMPAVVGDTGGASRFFPVFRYQAKAPAKERPEVDGVKHPTVKPLALMQWLVRLVTPPGGLVLDPFAGSGTTLQAARDEGFDSIGIERDPAYLGLIAQRLGVDVGAAEVVEAPSVDVESLIMAAPDMATLISIYEQQAESWTEDCTRAANRRADELEACAA